MKHKSVAVSIHLSLVLEIFVCPVEEISVLHVNLQMYDRQAWLAVAYIHTHNSRCRERMSYSCMGGVDGRVPENPSRKRALSASDALAVDHEVAADHADGKLTFTVCYTYLP